VRDIDLAEEGPDPPWSVGVGEIVTSIRHQEKVLKARRTHSRKKGGKAEFHPTQQKKEKLSGVPRGPERREGYQTTAKGE